MTTPATPDVPLPHVRRFRAFSKSKGSQRDSVAKEKFG